MYKKFDIHGMRTHFITGEYASDSFQFYLAHIGIMPNIQSYIGIYLYNGTLLFQNH